MEQLVSSDKKMFRDKSVCSGDYSIQKGDKTPVLLQCICNFFHDLEEFQTFVNSGHLF